ncbi:MAG: hypothetical protein A2X59_08150 [Nitrospirae bacterium GWC2_42_7]|nr:MAG: hypothetical protein A2X59_08150 [Nitrospirae bacterium GWC2_42_7]
MTDFIFRDSCEICGSKNTSALFSDPFAGDAVWPFLKEYYEGRINRTDLSGGKYEILKCMECGFIWQAFILNEAHMEKLYNLWASPEKSINKKRYADTALFSSYSRQVQIIYSLIPRKPYEINVLDFGMGWGFWCLMVKAHGMNIAGFEISGEKAAFARSNGISVMTDFAQLLSASFDFINLDQVLEHLPDPRNVLLTLSSRLNAGGYIRISVPNGNKMEKKITRSGWKPSKDALHPLEHINCFTNSSLSALGRTCGLTLNRQPLIPGNAAGISALLRSHLARFYREFFGTTLYFKKTDGYMDKATKGS